MGGGGGGRGVIGREREGGITAFSLIPCHLFQSLEQAPFWVMDREKERGRERGGGGEREREKKKKKKKDEDQVSSFKNTLSDSYKMSNMSQINTQRGERNVKGVLYKDF